MTVDAASNPQGVWPAQVTVVDLRGPAKLPCKRQVVQQRITATHTDLGRHGQPSTHAPGCPDWPRAGLRR
jgi:hypothetical protein